MNYLIKESFVAFYKKIGQFISLILLVVAVVMTFGALFGNSQNLKDSFFEVKNSSQAYDYRYSYNRLTLTELGYKLIIYKLSNDKEKVEILDDDDLENAKVQKIENGQKEKIDQKDAFKEIKNENKKIIEKWDYNYLLYLNNLFIKKEFNDEIISSYYKEFVYSQNNHFYRFESAFNFKSKFNRNNVNEVYITNGRKPKNRDEIVISELYAKKNNIRIGQNFKLPIYLDKKEKKVVGLGYSYSNINFKIDFSFPQAQSTKNSATIYVDESMFDDYKNSDYQIKVAFKFNTNEKTRMLYRLEQFLSNGKITSYLQSLSGTNSLGMAIDNFEDVINLQIILYSVLGTISAVVVVFIIIFFIRKEVENKKKQIGVLKSLGYQNSELAAPLTITLWFSILLGIILGYILSLSIQTYFNSFIMNDLNLPIKMIDFKWQIIAGILVITPVAFLIIVYFLSWLILRKDVIKLIYNQPSNSGFRLMALLKKPFIKTWFGFRLVFSFTLKSIGKITLIFIAFTLALFILFVQFDSLTTFDHLIKTAINNYNSEVRSIINFSNQYQLETSGLINREVEPNFKWLEAEKIGEIKKINLCNSDGKKLNIFEIIPDILDISDISKILENPDILKGALKTLNNKYLDLNECSNKQIKEIGTFFDLIFKKKGTSVWLEKLSHSKPRLTFGSVVYQKNLELPILSAMARWKKIDENNPIKIIEAIGLKSNEWESFFNLKLNEEEIKDFFELDNKIDNIDDDSDLVIPIIINYKTSLAGKLKVNDKFKLELSFPGLKPKTVNFKVLKIEYSNNPLSGHFYISDLILRKILDIDDLTANKALYNKLLSKIDINNIKDIPVVASNNNRDVWDIPYSSGNNYLPIDMIKNSAQQKVENIRLIMHVIKFITIITIIFILIVIVNIVLDENKVVATTMKVMGYSSSRVGFYIISPYIIVVILGFIASYALSYGFWQVLGSVIFLRTGFLLILPFSWLTLVSVGLIVSLIITIVFSYGWIKIKRSSLMILTAGS